MLMDMAKASPVFAEHLKTAEEWCGVIDGNWTTEADEKFAQGFEKYVFTGETPTSKIAALLRKLKAWGKEILAKLKGINLTDSMINVYDALLGGDAKPVKKNLTQEQKAKVVEVKDRLKNANTQDLATFEKAIDNLMGSFPQLITDTAKRGANISHYIRNVDTDTMVLEVMQNKDGIIVNGATYTNVAEAIDVISAVLDSSINTNLKPKPITPNTEEAKVLWQKGNKNLENNEKVMRAKYEVLRDRLAKTTNLAVWDSALTKTIEANVAQGMNLPSKKAIVSTITQLNNAITETTDEKKKAAIQAKIDRLTKGIAKINEEMRKLFAVEDTSLIPTYEKLKMVRTLNPELYDMYVDEPYINILMQMVEKSDETNKDQLLQNLINVSMKSRAAVPTNVSLSLRRTTDILLKTFGKVGATIIGKLSHGIDQRNEYHSYAIGHISAMQKAYLSDLNHRKQRYSPDEMDIINSAILGITSDPKITDKWDAIEKSITDAKAEGINIDLADVKDIYDNALAIMDYFRNEISAFNLKMGETIIGLVDDYLPLWQVNYDNEIKDIVSDRILPTPPKDRTDTHGEYDTDLLNVIKRYVSLYSNYLAFYEVEQYYLKQANKDLPMNLRAAWSQNKRELVREYLLNSIGQFGGKKTGFLAISKLNLSSLFLGVNLRQWVLNYSQRYQAAYFVSPGVMKTTMSIVNPATGELTESFKKKHPNLSSMADAWNRQHGTMFVELAQQVSDYVSDTTQSGATHMYATIVNAIGGTILRKGGFGRSENGNWSFVKLAGIIQSVVDSSVYKQNIKDGMSHIEAIDKALANPKLRETAKVAGNVINAAVNVDPNIAYSPAIYGTLKGAIKELVFFVRFRHNMMLLQWESTAALFKGMRSNYSRAMFNALLWGNPDDQSHAATMQAINDLRAALDPVSIKKDVLSGKLKWKGYDYETLKGFVKMLDTMYDTLSREYKKNNKTGSFDSRTTTSRLWSGNANYVISSLLVMIIFRAISQYVKEPLAEKLFGSEARRKVQRRRESKTLLGEVAKSAAFTSVNDIGFASGLTPDIHYSFFNDPIKNWRTGTRAIADPAIRVGIPPWAMLDAMSTEITGVSPTKMILDELME